MSLDADSDTLYKEFQDNYPGTTTGLLPTVIIYDDIKDEPPDDASFVRVAVIPVNQAPASIGGTKYRTHGLFAVQCFAPAGKGGVLAKQIADDVVSTMRNKNLSGLIVRAPDIERIGVSGAYYGISVSFPWHKDAA